MTLRTWLHQVQSFCDKMGTVLLLLGDYRQGEHFVHFLLY